jgi:hypothetical protein
MVEDVALHTKTARDIVRKGGLRQGTGEDVTTTGDRARTVVDAFIDPAFDETNWQWYVDLTGCTQVRLFTRSANFLTLYYSLSASDALNPGDYAAVTGTLIRTGATGQFVRANRDIVFGAGAGFVNWILIDEALRGPLRLSISTSNSTWTLPLSAFDTANRLGFLIGVQAQ